MEGQSHTTGARFIKQSIMFLECSKSENYRNRNIRDKALEEMVKELNIPDLTPEDVKLKIKSIRGRYFSLLLIIIRQTVLETSLNEFYTYLDLHLSIRLTMCSMHLICYVSLSTSSPTTVAFFFYFFFLICIDILY
jgi:hypothetical protein